MQKKPKQSFTGLLLTMDRCTSAWAVPNAPAGATFTPGKSFTVCDGKDVTLIACGIMVAKAKAAADLLAAKGISARVINMSSIKPIDEEAILKAAEETGHIVTCEEHSIKGGLGGAVAEVLCLHKPVPMTMVGVNDSFGESGTADDLLKKYGLTAEHIAEEAEALLKR